jgi:hypothetical protein
MFYIKKIKKKKKKKNYIIKKKNIFSLWTWIETFKNIVINVTIKKLFDKKKKILLEIKNNWKIEKLKKKKELK